VSIGGKLLGHFGERSFASRSSISSRLMRFAVES
jgi:hypothetical protein